jgi:hypothetical protein
MQPMARRGGSARERRAGHHAPDTRIDLALLIAILAVAAGLRLVRIDSGIPFALGIDEPELLVRAVRMMQSGDFNPHFFDYPSLPIYLHLFVAIGRFLVGAMSHEFRELAKVDFTDFVLWSRMATAAMGVATVYVTYRIGQHWGRWHALPAVALASCRCPRGTVCLTDTPMTLCVAGRCSAIVATNARRGLPAAAIAGRAWRNTRPDS